MKAVQLGTRRQGQFKKSAVFLQNRNKQLDNRLKQFYYNSVNYKVFENKLRNNVQISMTKIIKYG